MKIAIAGGTGFVGTALIKELVKETSSIVYLNKTS